MSPPYPGVHILYHRWQVKGGKETPAPFWIANSLDGAGTAYYTMNARASSLDRYFTGIRDTFSKLARIVSSESVIERKGSVTVENASHLSPTRYFAPFLSMARPCE